MSKVLWKPGTMIYPLPAVMVSCGSIPEEYNIITISWTGTICTDPAMCYISVSVGRHSYNIITISWTGTTGTDPAMCYISVRPGRHSYNIIRKNGEYVINLTTRSLTYATDWCGVKSGKDYKKFSEMKLTPVTGTKIKAPLIKESPVNIECIVTVS